MLKIDENDQNAFVNIFQGTTNVIVINFVDCYIPLGHFSPKNPNIMAVNRILHPLVFTQQFPFWHFWGDFDLLDVQYQNLVNTNILLTKNLEDVFHALKSPHPKYHVNIITGSKKIEF